MTIQMQVTPGANAHSPISVAGRSYTGAPGSFLTVPYQEGLVMLANGWATNCVNGCGVTADRPAPNSTGVPIGMPGITFLDTTLGAFIVWDGANWRNALTGAVA